MSSNKIVATFMLLSLVAFGAGTIQASEVTGSFGATADDSTSSSGGSLSGQVGDSDSTVAATSDSESSSSSAGGRSGSRRNLAAAPSNSGISADNVMIIIPGAIQSDGSLATASDFNGTGGGFDPELESLLAGETDGTEGTISPSEAVAFNTSGDIPDNPFIAAAAGAGTDKGRLLVTIALGIALLGLAGYAAHSYVAYKKSL